MPLRYAIRLTFLLLCGLGTVWAQADGTLRWAYTTGNSIESSPSLGPDGTIYFGSQDNYVYAVTPTGGLKWRFLTQDNVDSSPAVAPDGSIYFGSWDGHIYALYPSGSLKWQYDTGTFVSSSPSIGTDGTVYFGAGDSSLCALDANGSLKWRFFTGGWVESAPASASNGMIYFGSWDGSIYSLTNGGNLAWSFKTGGAILSSPAIGADGTIYIGSTDTKLYAIMSTGVKLWAFATGAGIIGSPVVDADGTIYIGSTDGNLYALTKAGKKKWVYASGASIASTPVLRAGSLIVGTGANAIVGLATNDGHVLWTVPTGDWVDSSPVVAPGGNIYVGSLDNHLYALSGNGLGVSPGAPWPSFHGDIGGQSRADSVKVAQTITFVAPATMAFTSAPIPLAATATSGLPVTLSILAGPAIIAGNSLALTGPGTVTVRASQPGNVSYLAAANVDHTFNVPDGFTAWQAVVFSAAVAADSTKSGPNVVLKQDGLPNLVKYSLGLDPTVNAPASALPTTSSTTADWVYSYTRPTNIFDVTYTVEVSTDLVSWTNVGVVHELVSSDGTTDTWRGRFPRANTNSVFFRLKVEQ